MGRFGPVFVLFFTAALQDGRIKSFAAAQPIASAFVKFAMAGFRAGQVQPSSCEEYAMPNATALRQAGKLGACALFLTLALGSAQSWAFDRSYGDNGWDSGPRVYRSYSGRARYCIPANGAQIRGGFAGPDDLIDPVTGDICPR